MLISKHMKISGIIYLHDISLPIVATTRSHLENFHVNSAARAVILGTTMGEGLQWEGIGEREQQLARIFKGGARMASFQNTSDSAWKMVNMLLDYQVDGQMSKDDIVVV